MIKSITNRIKDFFDKPGRRYIEKKLYDNGFNNYMSFLNDCIDDDFICHYYKDCNIYYLYKYCVYINIEYNKNGSILGISVRAWITDNVCSYLYYDEFGNLSPNNDIYYKDIYSSLGFNSRNGIDIVMNKLLEYMDDINIEVVNFYNKLKFDMLIGNARKNRDVVSYCDYYHDSDDKICSEDITIKDTNINIIDTQQEPGLSTIFGRPEVRYVRRDPILRSYDYNEVWN